MVGTTGASVDGRPVPIARTTPEAPDLHRLLARMRDEGVQAAALEVSSHALDQHRVDGIVFDVAIFTNLSQDHLDFHGNMEAYFEAKARLFTPEHARRAVVNADDPAGRRLADGLEIAATTFGAGPGSRRAGRGRRGHARGDRVHGGRARDPVPAPWRVQRGERAGRRGRRSGARPRRTMRSGRGSGPSMTCPAGWSPSRRGRISWWWWTTHTRRIASEACCARRAR